MKTSNKGLNLIKQFEGCRLQAYKAVPSEKYYTIGYGHYGADVGANMVITQAQAESYLTADLAKFERYVVATKLPLNQNQFDALVSFTYNCGQGNLKKLVANRTLSQIANALLLYNKAGGRVLAGLTRRRQAERSLFLSEAGTTPGNQRHDYQKGASYKLQSNMNVRESPWGDKKSYADLTDNGKAHAVKTADGTAVLKKGTVVTCGEVLEADGSLWMRIPSGWVCAINKEGTVYIK